MISKFLMASALSLCLTGAASAATIVQNGSFEDGPTSPALGNWAIGPLSGWTTTSGGIEVQSSGLLGFAAYDGDHYVELDGYNNYTLSQSVNLSVGSYVLSFAYRPRTEDSATNVVEYSLGSLFGTPSVTGSSTTSSAWSLVTQTFNVTTAGSYLLAFTGAGTDDSYGGLIDDVSIVPTVPVPAGGVLMLSGLAGLAALRRRKRG